MKAFQCDHCGNLLFFENTTCLRCANQLGFIPDFVDLVTIKSAGDNLWRPVGDRGSSRFRQCQNTLDHAACNWMVSEGDPNPLCRACRLNLVIPDLSIEDHRSKWLKLETAKRRVLYSCLRIQLPTEEQDEHQPLRFKFIADSPGEPAVLTGHAGGVITVNIAEADDAERERRRAQMHEPFRTLIGHLRHELAHYYWDRLIGGSTHLEKYREVFGNEQTNYSEALQRHYSEGPRTDWQNHFVSAYATAHPWEDWAETFAHYLHMTDTLETAGSFGLSLKPSHSQAVTMRAEPKKLAVENSSFEDLVTNWLPLTHALNELNRGMGLSDLYPFVLSSDALAKLRFVHQIINNR